MASLHVHEHGDPAGPPVVALHGIRGHGGRWRFLARDHLADRRVVAPDLRGHGRSPWEPPWTLEHHAADVLSTMDSAGVGRADVVAHSFGAAVAVHLSRLAPARVRRLVLLDPGIGLPADAGLRGARLATVAHTFADPAQARAARTARWPAGATTEMVDAEIAEHLGRLPDGRWGWRFEPAAVVAAFGEMSRPAVTPAAGIPTLLVPATRDRAVPAQVVARYESELGRALEVVTLDGDHSLYLDRPRETGELVARFLA
jgi:lipase